MKNLFAIASVICCALSASGQAPHGPDRVNQLLALLTKDGYEAAVAEELASIENVPIPTIVSAYRSAEHRWIMRGLVAKGKSATPALIALLSDDVMAGAALATLGKIKDPKSLPAIVQVLNSNRDPEIRGSAAACFGDFECAAANDILSTCLQTCEDEEVRDKIAQGLANSAATTEQLINSFKAHPFEPMGCGGRRPAKSTDLLLARKAGREALRAFASGTGRLGAPALDALADTPEPGDLKLFLQLWNSSDRDQRINGAYGLARLGTVESVVPLLESGILVERQELAFVAVNARRSGAQLVLDWLWSRLDEDPNTLQSLAQLEPNSFRVLAVAETWLRGTDQNRVAFAREALINSVKLLERVPLLLDLARQAATVDRWLLWSASFQGDERAIPLLVRLYRDPGMREDVLGCLSSFRTATTDRLILQALSDPDEKVRLAGVEVAGSAMVTATIPTLCRLLDAEKDLEGDADDIVRALGKIGDKAAIPSICRYVEWAGKLEDFNSTPVCRALASIGDAGAAAFGKCWGFLTPVDQQYALEELGSIPGRVALRELKRVADDPLEYLRLRRVAKEVIARRGKLGIDAATVVDE